MSSNQENPLHTFKLPERKSRTRNSSIQRGLRLEWGGRRNGDCREAKKSVSEGTVHHVMCG